MSINVFWSSLDDEWLRAKEPESVYKIFHQSNKYDKNEPFADMVFCPSFNENIKNTFAMRSIYDYSFFVDGNNVYSDMYNQYFFEKHVIVRSTSKRLFSFIQPYIFFTDSDSLDVTLSQTPFFEDNNITERCIILPGKLDIGKWFRNTDTTFFLKKKFNEFKIENDEIYSYVTFHTEEKINFIEFRKNDLLMSYLQDSIHSKSYKKRKFSLSQYYSISKNKKFILKEIEKNII